MYYGDYYKTNLNKKEETHKIINQSIDYIKKVCNL